MIEASNQDVLDAVKGLRNDLEELTATGANTRVVVALRELKDKVHAIPTPRPSELDSRALGLLEDVDTSLFALNEKFRSVTDLISALQDKSRENEFVLRQLRSSLDALVLEIEARDNDSDVLDAKIEILESRLDDIAKRQIAVTESFTNVVVVLQEYQASTTEQVESIKLDVNAALAAAKVGVHEANLELEARLIDEIGRAQRNTTIKIDASQKEIEDKFAIVKSALDTQNDLLNSDVSKRLINLEANLASIVSKLKHVAENRTPLEVSPRIVDDESVVTLESNMVDLVDEALTNFQTVIKESDVVE